MTASVNKAWTDMYKVNYFESENVLCLKLIILVIPKQDFPK